MDAPIGAFPIPPGSAGGGQQTCGKQVLIELSAVTPAQASASTTSALPRAGYKITDNSTFNDGGNGRPSGVALIDFTGHGYKGTIDAVADMGALSSGSAASEMPSGVASNFMSIIMSPPGSPGCLGPSTEP